MAQTVAIPGRRISDGDSFVTDWIPRGGDCMILRVQFLVAAGATVSAWLETRGEDGSTITTPLTPTTAAISSNTTGVKTCLYLATAAGTARGAQEQVRVGVACGDGSGSYCVVRILPLVFFDNAVPA